MNKSSDGWAVLFNSLALVQSFFTVFAFMFFVAARADMGPMLPELYGKATEYPAEAWALWFFVCHGASSVALWHRERWRGMAWVAAAGCIAISPAYLLIAAMATPAAMGSIITLHTLFVGLPSQILCGAVVILYRGRGF